MQGETPNKQFTSILFFLLTIVVQSWTVPSTLCTTVAVVNFFVREISCRFCFSKSYCQISAMSHSAIILSLEVPLMIIMSSLHTITEGKNCYRQDNIIFFSRDCA